MKKITLIIAMLFIAINVHAQTYQIKNQINCDVEFYIHCMRPGWCSAISLSPIAVGPVLAGATVTYSSSNPCSTTPFFLTPYYEFIIKSGNDTCADLNLGYQFISPLTPPHCFTHLAYPTVTSTCGCLQEGQNIQIDFDPSTHNFTIHY